MKNFAKRNMLASKFIWNLFKIQIWYICLSYIEKTIEGRQLILTSSKRMSFQIDYLVQLIEHPILRISNFQRINFPFFSIPLYFIQFFSTNANVCNEKNLVSENIQKQASKVAHNSWLILNGLAAQNAHFRQK